MPGTGNDQHDSQKAQRIAIAATFTAEPIAEPLNFWMNELEIPCSLQFAGYSQVFQELLDPRSTFSANARGLNVALIRLEDWWQAGGDPRTSGEGYEERKEQVRRNAQELHGAITAAGSTFKVPLLLCFCAPSESIRRDETLAGFLHSIETQLADQLKDCHGIYVVTAEETRALYPVKGADDLKANQASHVPYTREYFQALATMIARRFYRIQTPPHKVLVFDCDNTLWQGVCGEDGPTGVQVGNAFRSLQEFVIAQREAGMLLCLCSKNNEEDVWKVFENNPGMLLKREHLSSYRINWQPKSENLRSLAAELQLGLNSFIFLDDSAMECAEVEARCPEVLALQLPAPEAGLKKFLSHVWAFDHLKITEEDRQRNDHYAQNASREDLRALSPRLEDFLAGLELQLEFLPMTKAELPRVAQLTQRTNQFNFTSVRRSAIEIDGLCSAANADCHVIRLRDRFGDYGLVGAMIFTRQPGRFDVDNVLLSCRALGRRVEHRMLSHLGRLAQENGSSEVWFNFVPTERNKPARDFLESIGASIEAKNGVACQIVFDAGHLAQISSELCGNYSESGSSLSGQEVGPVPQV